MPDETLNISQNVLERLGALRSEKKFVPSGLYPGAPTEEIRQAAESVVNVMVDRLVVGLPRSASKSFLLSEFLTMLKEFEESDTEEREQACSYCERVMGIAGVSSSDGVLNKWLYGFDPSEED